MNTTEMPVVLLSEEALRKEGIRALMQELGPVEAIRFLNLINPPKPGADSVKQRREWLASIDEKAFVAEAISKLNEDPRHLNED